MLEVEFRVGTITESHFKLAYLIKMHICLLFIVILMVRHICLHKQ